MPTDDPKTATPDTLPAALLAGRIVGAEPRPDGGATVRVQGPRPGEPPRAFALSFAQFAALHARLFEGAQAAQARAAAASDPPPARAVHWADAALLTDEEMAVTHRARVAHGGSTFTIECAVDGLCVFWEHAGTLGVIDQTRRHPEWGLMLGLGHVEPDGAVVGHTLPLSDPDLAALGPVAWRGVLAARAALERGRAARRHGAAAGAEAAAAARAAAQGRSARPPGPCPQATRPRL
jgi:hypothetical protein